MSGESETKQLLWKVNTVGLLREIANNSGHDILRIPIAILGHLLHSVAERAAQLHDHELDKLMLRLALYDIGEVGSPEYNKVMSKYGL